MHVDGVEPNSLARAGEKLVVALDLLPQFCKDTGIATHHVARVLKGAELAGTVCAPSAARPRLRLRRAGAARRASSPPRPAPASCTSRRATARTTSTSAGEHDLEVPDTVGDDGTFNAWVPLFAGLHVYKAADPVCAALIEAGGLLARGKLVHSYPHSWRSRAPLIFRATPQWFIRLDGPERIREKALDAIATDALRARAGPQPPRLRWSPSRPYWCISRQRAWGVPITVFVDKRTGEPLRDEAVVARIVEAFRRRAPTAGTRRRRRASSATTAIRTTTSR